MFIPSQQIKEFILICLLYTVKFMQLKFPNLKNFTTEYSRGQIHHQIYHNRFGILESENIWHMLVSLIVTQIVYVLRKAIQTGIVWCESLVKIVDWNEQGIKLKKSWRNDIKEGKFGRKEQISKSRKWKGTSVRVQF